MLAADDPVASSDPLKEIEAIRRIPIVPTMLEVICHSTGMGFAAIARVTEDRWIACSVRDEVAFGLQEGGELPIATTLCNEIRDHRTPILIDHVAKDNCYANHHTPRIYGLQSYISFPIILQDGSFFGTLCAIDARPAQVNNSKTIGLFTMFTQLLSFHLQSQQVLEHSYHTTRKLQQQNTHLTGINQELDSFVHSASHDLKSPVTALEGLLDRLAKTLAQEPINRAKVTQIVDLLQMSLKRFRGTLQDLTTFVEAEHDANTEPLQATSLVEVTEQVKQELAPLLEATPASIQILAGEHQFIPFPRKSLKSILYNPLSNAIKYRSPERHPVVVVQLARKEDKYQLTVTDNGLGIPADKQGQIFSMFTRLHDHVEGSGLGLYIVKRMMDRHKGQIKVDSTLHQGTTFTLIFA